MPTRGRQELAKLALECFYSQTYENRELVIVDDFDELSFPNGVNHPLVRYHISDYRQGRLNIPMKRNVINGLTAGEVIAHWDSDDWSAPERLTQQVALMEQSGKQVAGYHSMLFYDERDNTAARYEGHQNMYALGTSLLYRKDWWQTHQFKDALFVGSDNDFVRKARDAHQLATVDAGLMMVARCHSDNTSPKYINRPGYIRVPLESIPTELRNPFQIA